MRWITKKDGYIILAALLLALALALLFARRRGGDMVRVYVGGQLYTTASLLAPQVILVEQGDGRANEIVIEGGRVYMRSASCKNQECVHQGEITAQNAAARALGNWIICMPNQVTVELVEDAR
ncbi:MAG: NusG domain II-containing protein [Christensenellaceae bacterium]|jgi:hypothetical protein|nr:NusG domain II-containing protein [Christensenellaceae bacterium]